MAENYDETRTPNADVLASIPVPPVTKSWKPTKKWLAALLLGLASVGAHAFLSGGWDAPENAELTTLGAALLASYWKKNDDTPEGVPEATA